MGGHAGERRVEKKEQQKAAEAGKSTATHADKLNAKREAEKLERAAAGAADAHAKELAKKNAEAAAIASKDAKTMEKERKKKEAEDRRARLKAEKERKAKAAEDAKNPELKYDMTGGG